MMIRAVRFHWPALLLALAVGFILVLPALSAKVRFGTPFGSPLNIRAHDNFFYLARIRDVLDGHPTLGNAYLWEHKSKPPSPLFLGEWLLAQPLRLFGADVVRGSVFSTFLLPAVAAALTYACLFAVTRLRWYSVVWTLILFRGVFAGAFARAVSPQFNFIFWLTEVLFVHRAFLGEDSERRKVGGVLAALNFGFLFYLYPYYWTFFLAFFVMFALAMLAAGHRRTAALVGAVVAGGLIVAIPYFLTTVQALSLAEYGETMRRIGLIDTRFPSGLAIVVPAALLFFAGAFLVSRGVLRLDRYAAFWGSGVAAAVASVNQHLITGKNLEFSSHYYMLSMFWFAFAGAYLFESVWKHPRIRQVLGPRRRYAAYAVAGALAAFAILSAYRRLPEREVLLGVPPAGNVALLRYVPVLEWLDRNTRPDDVVYAPEELAPLIPIYTADNVLFAPHANLSFLTDDEVADRFLLAHYYNPLDASYVRERARQVFGYFSIDTANHLAQENRLRAFLGLQPKPVPPAPAPEALETVLRRHRELRSKNFGEELRRYRVDYVVWDRAREPVAAFDAVPAFEAIADVGEFRVYRVRSAPPPRTD